MKRAVLALSPLLIAAFALLNADYANAQTPAKLMDSGNWLAYTLDDQGSKTCYMYSTPTKSDGNYKRRGDPHAMVTRRQGGKTIEEVSVTAGYPFKEGKAVEVKIDGRPFNFGITHKEHAWANDDKEDRAAVKAMIKGITMSVRGTSQKGTFSVDTYSLKGFTATHNAIVKACP